LTQKYRGESIIVGIYGKIFFFAPCIRRCQFLFFLEEPNSYLYHLKQEKINMCIKYISYLFSLNFKQTSIKSLFESQRHRELPFFICREKSKPLSFCFLVQWEKEKTTKQKQLQSNEDTTKCMNFQ